MSYLHTFGSASYIHVPKETRHKMDPLGMKAIFIGYSLDTKGHKFYDPSSKKVIVNCDVIFHESSMGGAWSSIESHDSQSLFIAFPLLLHDCYIQGICNDIVIASLSKRVAALTLEDDASSINIFAHLPIEDEHRSYDHQGF